MNHRWPHKDEEIVVTSHDSRDGNEHRIRACYCCGIVKITVIPPITNQCWHEWITSSGRSWIGEASPPCVPKGLVEPMGAPHA